MRCKIHHWIFVIRIRSGSEQIRIKRQIRVSMLRRVMSGKYVLLFSTDVEMDAFEVVAIYRSRFQVEFLFREGKQELGLNDCQARDEKALSFHFNLSLSALNLLRLEEPGRGEGSSPSPRPVAESRIKTSSIDFSRGWESTRHHR